MTVYDLIIPFLRPIELLLRDETVSEIMCNANGTVYLECDGIVFPAAGVHIEQGKLASAVRMIARQLGDDMSEASPTLEARLPDGARVAAAMPPASPDGTILSVRKFRERRFTAGELVARGMMTEAMLDWLIHAIERERATILISGGTGTGKTSMLNALAAFMPIEDRIVLIEDTSEIVLSQPNVVRLEARREQPGIAAGTHVIPGVPAVEIRDLLRLALRLRPDRIILGEVRGAEAFDLLQTLNTGHSGTLSTIHANTAALALSRLRTCVAMAGVGIPDLAVARNIGEVVNIVVHLERRNGQRRVAEVARVEGFNGRDFNLQQQYPAAHLWTVDPPPGIVGTVSVSGKKPGIGAPDDD